MKYQSIFIFIIYHIVANVNAGILTPQENNNRLSTCGQKQSANQLFFTQLFSINGISWMANILSDRHLLTSAGLMMRNGSEWRDGERIDNRTCIKGYIEVPKKYFKAITFSGAQAKIIEAYILCYKYMVRHVYNDQFPMIVEIDRAISSNYPCLPDNTEIKKGDQYICYHYNRQKNGIDEEILTNKYNYTYFVITQHDNSKTLHFGSPITKEEPGKPLQLVATYSFSNKESTEDAFLKTRLFEESICRLTGICSKPELTAPLFIPMDETTALQPVKKTPRPLSPAEDAERVKKCSNGFVYLLSNKINATATRISSRHLLTSANLVMNENYRWFDSLEPFDASICRQNNKGYIKVPEESLRNVRLISATNNCVLTPTTCQQVPNIDVKINGAYVYCNSKSVEYKETLPMIIELESDIQGDYSCLSNGLVNAVHDVVHSISYQSGTNNFLYRNLTIQYASPWAYFININGNNYDRLLSPGDILFKSNPDQSLKWDLIGVMTIRFTSNDGKEYARFININSIEEVICLSTGICAKPPPPPIPIPNPPSESSTKSSSESASSSPPPVPTETPSSLPIPPGNPSPLPVPLPPPKPEEPRKDDRLDVDKEYEEFLERRKGWDDPDDFDNDLFRSKDFKTGSGREKVILVLIIVFLMV